MDPLCRCNFPRNKTEQHFHSIPGGRLCRWESKSKRHQQLRIWHNLSGSSSNLEGFSPQAIFNLGISNSLAGQYIEAWATPFRARAQNYEVPLRFSEHHYQGTFCSGSEGVLSDLMSKANIRGNLSQYASDIQATNDQGFDYILGETNSYSCHVCKRLIFISRLGNTHTLNW